MIFDFVVINYIFYFFAFVLLFKGCYLAFYMKPNIESILQSLSTVGIALTIIVVMYWVNASLY